MLEEKDETLMKATLWLQKQEESMTEEGFTVTHNGNEFTFLPKFIDRFERFLKT